MGWFLLVVVLLLAGLGVLGLVIKLTLVLVLAILLAIAIVAAIGWFSFKAWVRDAQRRAASGPGAETGGPTYDVEGWVRRDPHELPPPDDPT
ncbi:MAG: hypothetical protein WD004_01735 [Actinomycetota bacterium]